MGRAEGSTAVHVARGSSYLLLQSMATNVMMVVSFSILARLITPLEMGGMAVLLILRAIGAQDLQLLDEYLGPRFRFIVRPLERLVASRRRDDPAMTRPNRR